jgi:predicted MFS family arabinose efflux permease
MRALRTVRKRSLLSS